MHAGEGDRIQNQDENFKFSATPGISSGVILQQFVARKSTTETKLSDVWVEEGNVSVVTVNRPPLPLPIPKIPDFPSASFPPFLMVMLTAMVCSIRVAVCAKNVKNSSRRSISLCQINLQGQFHCRFDYLCIIVVCSICSVQCNTKF